MIDTPNRSLKLPPGPQDGDRLAPHHKNQETLELLSSRRSTVAKSLTEPGPNNQELATLLRMASRVPDHGKLGPWRFIIFEKKARRDFGDHLGRIFATQEPSADETRITFERDRLIRAPVVVAVISKTILHPKAPKWEQALSSGAVCQNMLIGASAMGFAAQWLTEWYAYDEEVEGVLGLEKNERVAGYVYIGSTDATLTERQRPRLEDRVSFWSAKEGP